MTRHIAWIFAAAVALHLGLSPVRAATPEDSWPALAEDVFKGRPLNDGTGLIGIEMPARAEDAAIVPVTLRVTLPSGDARQLKTMTLVIDDNPAPVAATFRIGSNAGISTISTRVRVNAYTNVHAVAELSQRNGNAMSHTKKNASSGVWVIIHGSIRSVLYWLPRAHRYCCLINFFRRSGASV